MDYKKLNEKMSEFFDNVTGEELVAQLEELGYKLIEKEQKVKSVDLAHVVKSDCICVQTGRQCGFPCFDGCPVYKQ